MAKEEGIEVEGIIQKSLSHAQFTVGIANGHTITAYPAGKMRRFFIKILPGDKVTVLLSPYDLKRGRITFRHKA